MLATGNENFGAGDVVAAIRLGLCLGADNAQIGTGMGFGQAHGAGPLAAVHVGQVFLFQLVRGVGMDGQAGASRQHGEQAKGDIGRMHHFFQLCGQHFRHAHAAVLRIATDSDPAAFSIGLISSDKSIGSGDFVVVPLRALLIGSAVQWCNHIDIDLGCFFQDGAGSIRVHGFCQFG